MAVHIVTDRRNRGQRSGVYTGGKRIASRRGPMTSD